MLVSVRGGRGHAGLATVTLGDIQKDVGWHRRDCRWGQASWVPCAWAQSPLANYLSSARIKPGSVQNKGARLLLLCRSSQAGLEDIKLFPLGSCYPLA